MLTRFTDRLLLLNSCSGQHVALPSLVSFQRDDIKIRQYFPSPLPWPTPWKDSEVLPDIVLGKMLRTLTRTESRHLIDRRLHGNLYMPFFMKLPESHQICPKSREIHERHLTLRQTAYDPQNQNHQRSDQSHSATLLGETLCALQDRISNNS